MKLKLGEVRPMLNGLQGDETGTGAGVLGEKLPVKTAYWLARALTQLRVEFEPFERARQKLVEAYAKKHPKDLKEKGKIVAKKGDMVRVGNVFLMEDMEAFNKEYNELADQEIEIKYEPIPIENFIVKDREGKEINVLKGNDIVNLGRLIKEE